MDKHVIRSIELKDNVRSILRRCYVKGEPVSVVETFITKGPAYRRLYEESEHDASLFVMILARMAEQLSYDEFNDFWWSLSDKVYAEEAGYGDEQQETGL